MKRNHGENKNATSNLDFEIQSSVIFERLSKQFTFNSPGNVETDINSVLYYKYTQEYYFALNNFNRRYPGIHAIHVGILVLKITVNQGFSQGLTLLAFLFISFYKR